MIGWAFRQLAIWGGIGLLVYAVAGDRLSRSKTDEPTVAASALPAISKSAVSRGPAHCAAARDWAMMTSPLSRPRPLSSEFWNWMCTALTVSDRNVTPVDVSADRYLRCAVRLELAEPRRSHRWFGDGDREVGRRRGVAPEWDP